MEKKTSTIGMVAEMQKIQAERRASLEKSISEKKAALAELKDGKLDTELLDSLLDDIKALVHVPTEVIVPLEDVIKEYDFGSFYQPLQELLRMEDCKLPCSDRAVV